MLPVDTLHVSISEPLTTCQELVRVDVVPFEPSERHGMVLLIEEHAHSRASESGEAGSGT
jgi:hypothetical protein